ncbi:hypothetical protein RYX36_009030 [Vicia faba]
MTLQASSLQFPATNIIFIATSKIASRICNHELIQQLSSSSLHSSTSSIYFYTYLTTPTSILTSSHHTTASSFIVKTHLCYYAKAATTTSTSIGVAHHGISEEKANQWKKTERVPDSFDNLIILIFAKISQTVLSVGKHLPFLHFYV